MRSGASDAGCEHDAEAICNLPACSRKAAAGPGPGGARACFGQLLQQALHQRFGHTGLALAGQPAAQQVGPTCGRQRQPGRHVESAGAGAGPLGIHLGQLAQSLGCLLGAPGAGRQAGGGMLEAGFQGRPDCVPQAVARQRAVGVAEVVDEAQPVPAHVGVDGLPRLVQPGPGPDDAVAQCFARHGRQAGRPGATQRLQQEGLGLVATVVGQQHDAGTAIAGHLGQRRIAFAPGPGLDAVARGRGAPQAPPRQAAPAGRWPTSAAPGVADGGPIRRLRPAGRGAHAAPPPARRCPLPHGRWHATARWNRDRR